MDTTEIGSMLEQVRAANPLIYNITNVVVTNFTANGLLALGASPVMAYAIEEAADMASIAGALVLNIGTLNEQEVRAMVAAGQSANQHGVPVILDPVGVGATAYRTETARKLMKEINIAIVRGNAAEIANLSGESWQIKGVDAGAVEGDTVELAIKAANKWNCIIIITGKKDVITDGQRTYVVHNGHPLLTKVTGSGCLLTSVIGAYAAIEPDLLKASAAAVCTYGVAGQLAAEQTGSQGPGSFQIEFINQLAAVSAVDVTKHGKVDRL